MKKAFVTGITGQDGAYLAEILVKKGYKVYGGVRRTSTSNTWRLKHLKIENDIELVDFELLEESNITKTLRNIQPDEFYNLAAQSFVGVSFKQPVYTANATGLSVMFILDALKEFSSHTKFYQASTSEMFGKVVETPQKESTPFYPRSPYGVAKLFAHWATVNYRESYDLFCSTGILFNHESPLRGEEFVTRKITKGLVDITRGNLDVLKLGNLDAMRDWGFARDYCEGIYKINNHSEADDFILATGETHKISDFIKASCRALNIDIEIIGEGLETKVINLKNSKVIIEIDERFFRPCEVDLLVGDTTKAREILGWSPKTNFTSLVEHMIEEELKLGNN